MSRKRTTRKVLDDMIAKVKSEMSRLQDRYDCMERKLNYLQNQKRKAESEGIIDAYLSIDEYITFVKKNSQ